MRAGDTAAELSGRNQALLPYTQINDIKREGNAGRVRPGDGDADVEALLNALPADIPLSLEWPAPRDSNYSAEAWARTAIDGTRRFLNDYYAHKK
jgi:sugar phosphate isomerase/epimerase